MKFITLKLVLAPTDGDPKWAEYQARTLSSLCRNHADHDWPCTVGALACPFLLDEQAPRCADVRQEHWLKLLEVEDERL